MAAANVNSILEFVLLASFGFCHSQFDLGSRQVRRAPDREIGCDSLWTWFLNQG